MMNSDLKPGVIVMHFIWISVALCAALAISCASADKEQPENHVQTLLPTDSSRVKVMVLHSTDFSHELISNGTIAAEQKADLRFETPEVVEEIHVRNGQRVAKGQKIATLAPFKLKNALSQAHDNLEKSKLELQDVLISQGYTIRDSLNVPADIMKIAKTKSNYDNSVIQYELARFNLDNSVLYAPFDGIVANLFSKKYNMPPASDPFCTIIGSNRIEADFKVLESELALIKKGDQVQLSPFAISHYSTSGQVDEINPMVDENGMIRIKAGIRGVTDKLYDGMNIKVKIQQSAGKQLVIPKTALVLRNNKKVVFTAKNGKAMWNYVQTGLENSTGYVITEGLAPGDSVIYEGSLNLAHEAPILIEK